MFNRAYGLGLLVLFLVFASPAYGQSLSGARLFPPDTQAFPRIQTYLDIYDESGSFIHGIGPEDILVLENGKQAPLIDFQELRPGAQVVFQINPGETFTIRDSKGKSRFDYVLDSLRGWAAARQGSTVDDVSVVITGGPTLTHTTSQEELLNALETYQVSSAQLIPSLDTLQQSLDIVSDPPPRPGMEKAIFFITSPLLGDASAGLQETILRAQEQGIRIYVWLVGTEDETKAPDEDQLRLLAESTGGGFYRVSSKENIPSPEDTLKQLRNIYSLVYESSVESGPERQLEAQVQVGGEQLRTQPLTFNFDLQPPDPAFIMPAVVITRTASLADNHPWDVAGFEDLSPKEQTLPVLIDFPDGNARPLQWTRLYIDGSLAAENVAAPFDQFVWDLSVYTTTRQHVLQIEAMDSLGLQGKSIELPVDIRVIQPKSNILLPAIIKNGPAVLGLLVVFAASVVLLVLLLSGKISPNALRVPAAARLVRKPRPDAEGKQPGSPSEGLILDSSNRRITSWVSRLHWPQRRLSPQTYAYLVFESEVEDTVPMLPISISSEEITIGRDKSQAMLVLDDPSVEQLHSRLVRDLRGSYRLTDERSVAGTWVNYAPIPEEGVFLEHGDLIHIGRVAFRFNLRGPKHVRKPVVQRQENGH